MPRAGSLGPMPDIVAVLNIGAAEMLVVALVALIVVGPEQLPSLIRRVGKTVAQVRAMTDGIKDEFMSTLDESGDLKDAIDPKSWTAGSGTKDDPVVPRGSAEKKSSADKSDKKAEKAPPGDDTTSDTVVDS